MLVCVVWGEGGRERERERERERKWELGERVKRAWTNIKGQRIRKS